MTAKKYPPGATLNVKGTGRGMKAVTKPPPKKRGQNAEKQSITIQGNRKAYANLRNTPVAEIAAIPLEDFPPLTEKAKLFVKYWAEGNSIARASTMAGYGDSGTYCYSIRHRADVIAMYDAEKAKYQEAAQMSKVDVMNGLKDAIDMAKLMSEPATMIAGYREIGKLCGYYEPRKIDVNLNVNGQRVFEKMNKMSDAELVKIIEEASELGVDQAQLLDHSDVEDVTPK